MFSSLVLVNNVNTGLVTPWAVNWERTISDRVYSGAARDDIPICGLIQRFLLNHGLVLSAVQFFEHSVLHQFAVVPQNALSFNRNPIYDKWMIFHCDACLPEGKADHKLSNKAKE